MLRTFLVSALFIVAHGGFLHPGGYYQFGHAPGVVPFASSPVLPAVDESPKPYSFNYDAEAAGGSTSSRQESGDGSGRVTGSYALKGPDGRNRVVNYVADAGGFRATVTTNELGTESKNPADVTVQSSAPTPEQLALKAGATPLAASGIPGAGAAGIPGAGAAGIPGAGAAGIAYAGAAGIPGAGAGGFKKFLLVPVGHGPWQ